MKPGQIIRDNTSISQHSQNALGYAIPPIIPLKDAVTAGSTDGETVDAVAVTAGTGYGASANKERAAELASQYTDLGVALFANPCYLWTDEGGEASAWELPCDPIISVSGGNVVAKRQVAKRQMGGTVKELWSQDDFAISIGGTITCAEQADTDAAVWKIKQLCAESTTGLNVACSGLNDAFDIYRVCVESYEFPFTPGMGNQDFAINCVSDTVHDLLIQLGNV